MYTCLEYTLKINYVENQKYGPFLGSLFQGFLMEKIDTEYAEFLHTNGVHAYSQYVTKEEDTLKWSICTLNADAKDNIINKLLSLNIKEITLTHRNETFEVISYKVKEIGDEKLISDYYFGNCSRYLTIEFITPTAFKSNGKYVIYPDFRLIFQSLMNKFDAFSTNTETYSEEALEAIVNYVSLSRYKLRSVSYDMEGVKIQSFIGSVTIKISGPQQMVNLLWMLAKFGEYSGVGIKTGVGMGAIQCVTEEQKR